VLEWEFGKHGLGVDAKEIISKADKPAETQSKSPSTFAVATSDASPSPSSNSSSKIFGKGKALGQAWGSVSSRMMRSRDGPSSSSSSSSSTSGAESREGSVGSSSTTTIGNGADVGDGIVEGQSTATRRDEGWQMDEVVGGWIARFKRTSDRLAQEKYVKVNDDGTLNVQNNISKILPPMPAGSLWEGASTIYI
jgi:hypothetical protein